MSLIKCHWLLDNARAIAFTVSELLSENEKGSKITLPPTHTQIRVNEQCFYNQFFALTFETCAMKSISDFFF